VKRTLQSDRPFFFRHRACPLVIQDDQSELNYIQTAKKARSKETTLIISLFHLLLVLLKRWKYCNRLNSILFFLVSFCTIIISFIIFSNQCLLQTIPEKFIYADFGSSLDIRTRMRFTLHVRIFWFLNIMIYLVFL
jgi:hypothetical protein